MVINHQKMKLFFAFFFMNSTGENSTGTPKTDKDGFMEAAEGEIPFD